MLDEEYLEGIDESARVHTQVVVDVTQDTRQCPACLATYRAGPKRCPECGLFIGA